MAGQVDSLRSLSPPQQGRGCRQLPVWGGKKQTLTSKGTSTAVAQRGREFLREAPRRGINRKKAGVRPGGTTPQADFPNSVHGSPGAQRGDANSHQLEARRLPPNLPPNEETSPLGVVRPFQKRTRFRFRGTRRRVPSLRGNGLLSCSFTPTDLRRSFSVAQQLRQQSC